MSWRLGSTLLAFVTGICVYTIVVTAQNPCTDYVNIGDEKRNTMYILGVGDIPICDANLDAAQWYRFESTSGSSIPELQTVPLEHCGTFAPIFILQRITGENYHDEAKRLSTATAPICANFGTNCDYSSAITVRYCPAVAGNDEFFVYRLVAPPTSFCPIGYCAGQGCGSGTIWDDATQTCIAAYPQIATPRLTGPEIYRHEESITCPGIIVEAFAFFCKITYDEQPLDERARFDVDVLFDGQVSSNVPIITTTWQNLTVVIDERFLKGQLGKTISCQVTTYFEDRVDRSPPQESNRYWAGIRVDPYVVDFCSPTDPDHYLVDVYSTVPITCWHCYNVTTPSLCSRCSDVCSYIYTVADATGSPIKSTCELTVSGNSEVNVSEEGNEIQYFSGNIQFQMYKNAQFIIPNKNYVIPFLPFDDLYVGFVPFAIWYGYQIPPIMIQNRQSCNPDQCSSSGDPHYVTVYKNNPSIYLLGDFTVAKLYDEANKIFINIQARHFQCNNVATCNCAIRVREGNSILGIDGCKSLKTIRYLDQRDRNGNVIPDGSSMFVDASGSKFTITMKSGLSVRVDLWGYSAMSISLTLPAKYYMAANTSLCTWLPPYGTGVQFRVPPSESMFVNPYIPCVSWMNEPEIGCTCPGRGSTVSCPTSLPPGSTREVKLTSTTLGCSPSSSIPSVNNDHSGYFNTIDINDAYDNKPVDPDFGSDVNKVWPTPLGKTEQMAEDYCLDALRASPVYTQCLGKFDQASIIDHCKIDIQLTDDYSFVPSYVKTMENSCMDTLIAESNATNSDELKDDPNFSNISDSLCPGQCNQHGVCAKGNCTCDEGFAGVDCGVDITQPPVIEQLENEGWCDLFSRTCTKFIVVASNIYESETLTCQFTFFKLFPQDSLMSKHSTEITSAEYLTVGQILCPLPESKLGVSTGYFVSISNDGVLFSESHQFVVYDSSCLSVSNGTLSQENNTCFFNEYCYDAEELQSHDNCLACEPLNTWIDVAEWTLVSSCSRSCDYGVEWYEYGCKSVVLASQSQFCQHAVCPEKPEERAQGVIIGVNTSDTVLVLDKSDLFFQSIADSVNLYCREHSEECCVHFDLEEPFRTSKQNNITSSSQCNYASGFPVITYYNEFSHKVIVMMSQDDATELCGSLTKQQTQKSEVFVSSAVLFEAVSASRQIIEDRLGIHIMDIIQPPPTHTEH